MRYPVFIVGSPRSGTSILVDCLIAVGYRGFREGNFLSVWNSIERMVDRHFEVFADGNPELLVSKVRPEALKTGIFQALAREVDRLNPEPPWFDKTGNPEMILSIPKIREVWPGCVFIFARRRAIENVQSRIRKFPGHNFQYHCADWARTMSAWRAQRVRVPTGSYVEIDQRNMIDNPAAVASELGTLLQLGGAAIRQVSQTFQSNRPQETDCGTAERVTSLERSGWSSRQIDVLIEQCDQEMRAFGYSYGEAYWQS